jgi:competence protein ComEC
MVGISLLALAVSRPRDLPYALILAASLILILDPTAMFSIGFQLSFVAVASILLVSREMLSSRSESNVFRRWCRRLLAYVLISSAAYFGTLPIIAGSFHTLPTFGILANLLLVPLASVLVPTGVIFLGVLVLWPALGAVISPLFTPILSAMLTIADIMAGLPRAQIHLAAPSVPMLIGYYGLLGSLFLRSLQRWRLPLAGCGVVLLLAGATWQYVGTRAQQLRVTFLDVGAGDAIFVQIPGNHYLLIDGGGTYDGRFDIGARVIAPVLWDRHVHGFELMAMTHPQANHARGLVSLLQLFPTRQLLTNGTPLTAGYLRDLLAAGWRWGTQHHTALDGPRQWQWERLQLTVLAPPSTAEQQHTNWSPPTENDRSLVLRLQYGMVRLLLTGDIQHHTERWLLTHRADLRADILQVPHHGSRTSTLPAFVERVRPQVGVISLGASSSYGHPHPRILRVLESNQVQIFRTDHHGAITITTDGARYNVTPFRPYQPPAPSAQRGAG